MSSVCSCTSSKVSRFGVGGLNAPDFPLFFVGFGVVYGATVHIFAKRDIFCRNSFSLWSVEIPLGRSSFLGLVAMFLCTCLSFMSIGDFSIVSKGKGPCSGFSCRKVCSFFSQEHPQALAGHFERDFVVLTLFLVRILGHFIMEGFLILMSTC